MSATLPHCSTASALAESIAERLEQASQHGDTWQACCPAHDDRTPSLSLKAAADRVLLRCHAGCAAEAIVSALRLSLNDLFVKHAGNGHKRIVAVYDYYDAQGTLVHQTVRYEPKSFQQRRPDPAHPGAYLWSLKGIVPVLYNLPAVLRAKDAGEPVYLVEGEKDAESLIAMGLTATTNPMGAKKWRESYTAVLADVAIVMLPDNDPQGQEHAALVRQKLTGHVRSLRLVQVPAPHKDVSDWRKAGHTRADLDALVAAPQDETAPMDKEAPAFLGAKNGEPKETFGNFVLALEHLDAWAQESWFDVFNDRAMVGETPISRTLVAEAALAIECRFRLPVRNLKLLREAILYQCHQRPRDVIQEWLFSLPPWDETPRLTEWLVRLCEAPDTAYTREVGRLLLVSLVARALNPGCQCRSVVIFEGKEDIGKSKLVELIASPDWYRDVSGSLEGKEAHMLMKGAWIVELSELATMGKTEENRLKSFITMANDAYVPKYENDPIKQARRTILVGTVNPEGDGRYFKGQTGNTRFYPVPVTSVDLAYMAKIRAQLFAEALHYYQERPDTWWQLSPAADAGAREQREERRQASVYEEPLSEWLRGRTETSFADVAKDCLHMPMERWTKSVQMDVARALVACNWHRAQRKSGGKKRDVWIPA